MRNSARSFEDLPSKGSFYRKLTADLRLNCFLTHALQFIRQRHAPYSVDLWRVFQARLWFVLNCSNVNFVSKARFCWLKLVSTSSNKKHCCAVQMLPYNVIKSIKGLAENWQLKLSSDPYNELQRVSWIKNDVHSRSRGPDLLFVIVVILLSRFHTLEGV